MTATVTVTGPAERVATFRRVFGTDTVPVVPTAEPYVLSLPIGNEPCYLLDAARITAGQLERLVAHLAETFGDPPSHVATEILSRGLPIVAAGTAYTQTGDEGPS